MRKKEECGKRINRSMAALPSMAAISKTEPRVFSFAFSKIEIFRFQKREKRETFSPSKGALSQSTSTRRCSRLNSPLRGCRVRRAEEKEEAEAETTEAAIFDRRPDRRLLLLSSSHRRRPLVRRVVIFALIR
jgi:hypothetical protein